MKPSPCWIFPHGEVRGFTSDAKLVTSNIPYLRFLTPETLRGMVTTFRGAMIFGILWVDKR